MTYKELSDGDYTKLRKELLKEKGSSLQKDFLRATRDKVGFISWMDGRVNLEESSTDMAFDLYSDALSESEYKDPPILIERLLFKKWDGLTPAQASHETFWGYVTLEHIRRGIIDSCYLAANGGNLPGGLERIDKALSGDSEAAIDSIVRAILRRLSGLPEARGSKSVYVNCPFARAWWRVRIAREVSELTKFNARKILRVLRGLRGGGQSYWEEFIVLVVSRNSVLGDSNVRSALIWALAECADEGGTDKDFFTSAGLRKISKQIGVRSAWQELGVFPVAGLKDIMREEFLS